MARVDQFIIDRFASGKLTHNSMSAALVTAAVKSRAESLRVEPVAPDLSRLRKPYLGKRRARMAEAAIAALSTVAKG